MHADDTEVDEFLTTAELAKLIRVKPQTLRKKRLHGDGPPFVKFGNRVIYRRFDVDCYLAEKTFFSTAEVTASATTPGV